MKVIAWISISILLVAFLTLLAMKRIPRTEMVEISPDQVIRITTLNHRIIRIARDRSRARAGDVSGREDD